MPLKVLTHRGKLEKLLDAPKPLDVMEIAEECGLISLVGCSLKMLNG